MLKNLFLEIEKDFEGTLEYDVPRAKVAYYRIGGAASVLATPKTLRALELLHSVIQKNKVPYFIVGWGSNLLFSDDAFPGVVIRMKHLFTEVEELSEVAGLKGNYLKLGASLGAAVLLKVASEKGYGGLTCLTGIPGSVGGMVVMNAGTHLGEFGPKLIQTETLNLNSSRALELKTHTHVPSDFSYRANHFLKPGDLITHTVVEFIPTPPEEVKKEIDELYARRKATQPVNLPSCGSVFMNPKELGQHAWQVIEKLGLRGKQIGDAQISEKHPNFIVNLGQAKASDVRSLIELIKTRAKSELDIELHEEVKFIS